MKYNMDHLEIGETNVILAGDYAYCYRNAGSVYGDMRETIVDCRGIKEEDLQDHISEYAGSCYII